jgi:RHS repeat-associated protein
MLCHAKEEISLWPVMGASVLSLAAHPAFAETRIPEHTQLAESSRQGFESTNRPSHPEKLAAKSTTALGVSCFRRSGTAVGSGVVYDGDGNRVNETAGGVTTKYLVDTLNPTGYSQVLDELVSGSVTKTYTYGLQRISENQLSGSTWTPTFYGYDGHGNVRFTTNTAGTVGNTYQFDAFGMPIASTGTIANTYLYSGERFDSNLNLYHLRARYYNQATGRFETMDPALGHIFDPATLHKCIYTRSNPVNRADPRGTDDEGEVVIPELNIENVSTNVRTIANKLQLTNTAVGCAIHALKADLAGQCEGNPDLLIDLTNGNAFLPVSGEFVGCILHYLPEAEVE